MLFVAVGLIIITVGLGFARGNPLADNLLAGITAAIAAIPEEPPVLLAVVLGLGAYRLLRRSVLVRRLNAEEVLGAIDLIVTDKTGTLTQNRLEVISVADASGSDPNPAAHAAVLLDALRAEDDAWDARARRSGPARSRRRCARPCSQPAATRHSIRATSSTRSPPTDDGRMPRRPRAGRVTSKRSILGAPEAVVDLSSGSSAHELDRLASADRDHDVGR